MTKILLTISRHNYFIPKMNLKAIVATLEENCSSLFDKLVVRCDWSCAGAVDQLEPSYHWYWFHSCGRAPQLHRWRTGGPFIRGAYFAQKVG